MASLNYLDITAYDSTYIAKSELLLGTSNCVFSDWTICTYFKLENDIPTARFEVRDKMFSSTILFRTNNYKELKEWIAKHSEEIQNQIDTKAKEWIEAHKDMYK